MACRTVSAWTVGKGDSQTTVDECRSYLNRIKIYSFTPGIVYMEKTVYEFMKTVIPILSAGTSSKKASFVTGMSQKLPCFLDFLSKKGLTVPELQKAIPSIIPKKNLPSVYCMDELIQTLSAIDTVTFPMKRDYTILVFLMTYGFSIKVIKSIVSLELSEQKT